MTRYFSLFVFVILLVAAGAERVSAQGTFTTFRDISYAGDTLGSHRLDLYIPDNAAGRTPVVVWIHGGAWISGDKALGPNDPQLRLARSGYAVASINYRFAQEATFPAQIHDVKGAVRWLRAHAAQYNFDPTRFGVWGSSAGGHLAALLGTTGDVADMEGIVGGNREYSSRVQAAVDWYGPTDLLQMESQSIAQGCGAVGHNLPFAPQSLLIGCSIQTCQSATQRSNPLNYYTPDDPPFFIEHGTADCLVPIGQSQILQTLLRNNGHDSAFTILPGAGHGGPEFETESNLAQVEAFLQTRLRQFAAQPSTLAGRVTTPSGQALRNAVVRITAPDGTSRTATTSSFGTYQFENVAPGNVYTITVSSKRYRFAPRIQQVLANLSAVDFAGLE